MADLVKIKNAVSSNNGPTICKVVAPYNHHTVEEIFADLKGCIIYFYTRYKYRAPDYNIDMAMSDGFMGILSAIEFCKRTGIDDDGYAIDLKTGKNIIRTIEMEGEQVPRKVKKAIFSTLVYQFIRGAIQQGQKEYIQKIPSLDAPVGENTTLKGMLSADSQIMLGRRRKSAGVSDHVREIIKDAIENALSPKEQEVINHVYDIDNNGVESLIVDPNDSDFMISDQNTNTQTTAANHMGISKQRVCMIAKKALAKLNEYLSKTNPNDFSDHC